MKMNSRHLVQSTIPWQMQETQHDSKFTQLTAVNMCCTIEIEIMSEILQKYKSYIISLYFLAEMKKTKKM